jgi:hypothetical protein
LASRFSNERAQRQCGTGIARRKESLFRVAKELRTARNPGALRRRVELREQSPRAVAAGGIPADDPERHLVVIDN